MDAGESSFFVPEVPHFFKFMLDEDMQTGKLNVPKKFVRKYGTNLCKFNSVLLKVPTGDTWEVELRESGGIVRMEKGWPEFLSFYNIEHGDFLVFRYESGSSNELDVVVCNKTCTEVEYPKKSRRVNIPPIKVEDISEDEVTLEEAQERQPSRRSTRRTTPLRTGTVPSRRMTSTTTRLRAGSYSASEDNTCSGDSSPSRQDDPTERTSQEETNMLERKKKGKMPSSSQEDTRGPLRGTEKAKALDRAKPFRSTKPYFLVVMQPYYIRPPYALNFPIRFAKQHLGQKARGEMKLHISGVKKVWTAGYTITEARGQRNVKVVRGWKKFVKDNDLVRGDVCAFELIKGLRGTSFKITIFRAPRPAPSSRSSQSQARPAPLLISEHPMFQVVLKQSYLDHGYMHVPISFMRGHISLECKEWPATLKVGRGSLSVKFIMTGGGSSQPKASLCGGFGAFRKKNSLEAGDTCTFELIQRAEMVFRVSIRKANRAA